LVDVGKLEPLYIVGESVKRCNPVKRHWQLLRRLKILWVKSEKGTGLM